MSGNAARQAQGRSQDEALTLPARRLWWRQVLDTASLGLGSAGLLLAGGAARAGTPGVDMPPQPGTPRSQRLSALTESRLANGLALLHAQPQAEGANLPLVSIQLVLRT
ncbi:MAG: hypothetical protein RL722_2665, partial [Pseudomonadota bacterium]